MAIIDLVDRGCAIHPDDDDNLQERMRRKLVRLVVATACLAASPTAFATNGMRMPGFGPVQNSMGGVGVGVTLDSSAAMTNPAGLADLGRRVDVGATYLKPTVNGSATGVMPGVVNDATPTSSARGAMVIPAVGASIPMSDDLTVGLGLFGVSGGGVDFRSLNLYGGPSYTSYTQMRFTPAVAYKVKDLLAAGVTLNAMLAQLSYDFAAGMGQQPHQTATSLGVGATVGVRVTPMKELTIGAAYETKSFFQKFVFNIPAHQAPNPATGEMLSFAAGQDKLTFDQPSSATIGVGVRPFGDVLLVAADVQWIRWSETNGQNMPRYSSDITATGAIPFDLDWSDQWVFKIGAQVAATSWLRVRAGYNYGKMPLNPNRAFENLVLPAVAEHHFALGLGVDVTPRLAFNIAAMYSPKTELTGANATAQLLQSYGASMSQVSIDLGAAYRF